jgi:hypothetical protein
LSIQKGPKDRFSRRFSARFYTRILSNGEECDRDWLVYSKELDKYIALAAKYSQKGIEKVSWPMTDSMIGHILVKGLKSMKQV